LRILLIGLFLSELIPLLVFSQNWEKVGLGTDNGINVLYSDSTKNLFFVGGNFKRAEGNVVNAVASWNGSNWSSVGGGMTNCISVCNPIFAIIRYKGEIYFGGMIDEMGGVITEGIARWNDTIWQTVDAGLSGFATDFLKYENDLYVGGVFDSAGGIPANSLAKWDGNVWAEVFSFPNYNIGDNKNRLSKLIVYDGELYVGGVFADTSKIHKNIAKWDGNKWVIVGGGIIGSLAFIEDMEVFNGELYVGGYFTKADGNGGDFITNWDGSEWNSVGGGMNGEVEDLMVYNGELYAVGHFTSAGGVPVDRIAKWDGNEWCGLGGEFDNAIGTIAVYNDEIYIGGGFWSIDGDTVNRIAKWVGGSYTDTCGAISSVDNIVEVDQKIKVFPNPFSVSTTIQIQAPSLSNSNKTFSLDLYNVLGVSVRNIESTSGKITLHRDNLAPGIYFYKVSVDNIIFSKGKIVIR